MKPRLVYTRRAVKDVGVLSSEIKRRIGAKLRDYAADPLAHARKLTDPRCGTYRFRIGEYRVVFDFNGDEIVVLRIGHRKDIYRR